MRWELDQGLANRFAELPLEGICREYPNAPGILLNGPEDIRSPRELHPAFYGCLDWHSSVHSHWMLVRLLKAGNLIKTSEIRRQISKNLTASNIEVEVDYFNGPNRTSFERTYGWAWLLKLAEELRGWEEGSEWAEALRPLEGLIVERYLDFLPRQQYPIRLGTHTNTAFGLSFAFDYAWMVGHKELEGLVVERAKAYFGGDECWETRFEPGGADFFSPSLMEADLMRRVLSPEEFVSWLERFLPGLSLDSSILRPVVSSDPTDPQIAHLDGLNLSRAWCLRRVGLALPSGHSLRTFFLAAADAHAEYGLEHVATGDYMGEHWLASFAVYMLER